jgi:hypothetical protein
LKFGLWKKCYRKRSSCGPGRKNKIEEGKVNILAVLADGKEGSQKPIIMKEA